MTYFIGLVIALILNFIIVRLYSKNNLEPDWGDTGIRLFLVALSWVGAIIFSLYLISCMIQGKKPPKWL